MVAERCFDAEMACDPGIETIVKMEGQWKTAGNEANGDQTLMKMMGFSVFGSSVKRDHSDSDMSDMIKQVCAKSDIFSRFVSHLSDMKDTIDRWQSETDCCVKL